MSNASAGEALVFAALEIESAAGRAAFLDSACRGDVELRRQLDKLLNAHPRVGDFLNKPVFERLAAALEHADATQELGGSADGQCGDTALEFLQPSTRPGSLGRVGHYEVLQVLGRGGFGIVFRAFDEVLRKAVKLGYRDGVYLGTEVDLDPLRSDPAFSQVIEAVRKGGQDSQRKRE